MVTVTIDNKMIQVPENTTILEAARMAKIEIPTLCYLKDINEIGACRICAVDFVGNVRLVPACEHPEQDCSLQPLLYSSAIILYLLFLS